MHDLLPILRRHWGYSQFRPLQQPAMAAVMAGEDSLVILPTGGGKSLCFQAPAIAMEGTAIVVSPLISLMKDQVDALREAGVAAGKLHSGQPADEARSVSSAMREGRLKLLYVSPERLVLEGFGGIARGGRLSFLAVDEAHCISEWGHDFRPEYRQLREFRSAFPGTAIHAYTATATPEVARDIAKQLGMERPHVLTGSFDRPNLYYRAEERRSPVDQIAEIAGRHEGESGIVYCISRKDAEAVADGLRSRGLSAEPYHAGLADELRARTQDRFINDDIRIVVATIAFGMGIDKPDVRFVVHHGLPKSLENYQQESGRAGRDGLGSECVLLHAGNDFMKWKMIVGDQPGDQGRRTLAKLRAVEQYAQGLECRRRALLRYFGEDYPEENCQRCDICAGGIAPLADSMVVGQKILSCVKRLGEAQGVSYTTRVLVASKDKRIAEAGHEALSTYGILKEYERSAVASWLQQLVAQGFLVQDGGRESPLAVTGKGWELLRGKAAPQLLHKDPKARRGEARPADDWVGVDRELFDLLRQLRTAIAKDKSLPPYVIFGDRTLREMARLRPRKLEGLRGITGIGEAKFEAYGVAFHMVIEAWLKEHPQAAAAAAPPPPRAATGPANPNPVRDEAIRLLRDGRKIAEVASRTARAASTIEGYLIELIEAEGIEDPSPWVPRAIVATIEAAADKDGSGRLKPIFDFFGGEVPYSQIRIVLACRRNRAG